MAITYRTQTLETIIDRICSLTGYKWSSMTDDQKDNIISYVNMRVEEAWEMFNWYDLVHHEIRYFREGLWSAGTYNDGDIVYYAPEESYYENTSGGATTEEPTTGSDWEETESFERYIEFDQTSDQIERIIGAYRNSKFLSRNQTMLLYDLYPNKVVFYDYNLDYVYLEYTSTIPSFDKDTLTDEVPYIFSQYIVYGAYSDYLANNNQSDKSHIFDNRAKARLTDRYEDQVKRQNQLSHNGIRTGTLTNR